MDTLTLGSAETFKASYAGKTPRAGERLDMDAAAFHPFATKRDYVEILNVDAARGIRELPRWMVLDGWTDKRGVWHPPAKFIQANPAGRLDRIVIDIDVQDAVRHIQTVTLDDEAAPTPNLIVVNKATTHAQAHYLLAAPVPTTDAARRKPVEYAAKVQHALTLAYGGDEFYSNYVCRSPLSPAHDVIYNQAEGYELRALAESLGPLMATERKKGAPVSGLGRNCSLFDQLRHWAYANRERFTVREEFVRAVGDMAKLQNMAFAEPMLDSEVASVARSVASWTWRNLSEEGKAKYLHNRRSKGGRTKSVLKDLGYIGAAEKRRKNTPEKIMDVLG
jgi:hypothetical protein